MAIHNLFHRPGRALACASIIGLGAKSKSSGYTNMSANISFLAVDIGASSGRVMDCCWNGNRFKLQEVHRFPNGGVRFGAPCIGTCYGSGPKFRTASRNSEPSKTPSRQASAWMRGASTIAFWTTGIGSWGIPITTGMLVPGVFPTHFRPL